MNEIKGRTREELELGRECWESAGRWWGGWDGGGEKEEQGEGPRVGEG